MGGVGSFSPPLMMVTCPCGCVARPSGYLETIPGHRGTILGHRERTNLWKKPMKPFKIDTIPGHRDTTATPYPGHRE